MTEPDPLERYFDEFGRRLTTTADAGAGAGRRGRRRFALATAVALAAIGVTTLLLGASGERLDPVAEAQAALAAAPGEIVYMKVTTFPTSDDVRVSAPTQTTEQWSALDPPRWRLVQTLPEPGTGNGTVIDARGPISGRQEIAYAHGEQRTYLAERDTLSIRRGFNDDGPAARAPSLLPAGTGSGDIAGDLRSMLDGDVTDEGEQQSEGRTVRRFVSTSRSGTGDDTIVRRRVYDVDPQTFTPVGGEVSMSIQDRHGASARTTLTARLRVDAYERIPLDDATAKLLEIQTTPRTKVTVHPAAP